MPKALILLIRTILILPLVSIFPLRLPAPFYILRTIPINIDNIKYISLDSNSKSNSKLRVIPTTELAT